MAEYALSTAVRTLTSWLIEEAVLLRGVSGKVEQLRDKLRWMQSFLKDADAVHERSERFHTWTSQIREVAFDAEVLIETYICEAATAQSSWRKFLEPILKPIRLHKIRSKIEKIQSRVEHISKQKETFGIANMDSEEGDEAKISANARLRWWRQTSPNMQEDDLVDLVEDTKALMKQLSTMEKSRRVVSIVGMGGLGKTTLAKKMFNHPHLQNQFDCRSFVYVSEEYKRREILQKIIKDVSCPLKRDDFEKLEEKQVEGAMVEILHEFLNERRYVVVLDDIWKTEVWDGLSAVFPSGKMGSKVMLTTRNREVALYADPRSTPHEPRLLTEDESLELLLKKALTGDDHFPSDLEKIGRQMVVKCNGLPLAVVVLRGLLYSKKKTAVEWERVRQNISWHLTSAQDHISAVLTLSYIDLPSHLKSCFLHLGLFPEDSSIEKKHLIRLWVAEGFLPQQGEETPEGVAENCLNQLIDRCMVQVGMLTSLGSVKTIRIHDVLRDFSVLKGREENFVQIYTGQDIGSSAAYNSTKSRRLAIHCHATFDGYAFLNPYTQLSSFHNFCVVDNDIDLKYKNFKSLRVLELYHTRRLSSAVGNLNQLRFLGLRQVIYASSLSSLNNLQTLDMRFCSPYKMFQELKIENLRHLLLPENHPVDLTLGTMIRLQTLKGIEGGRWIDYSLAKMINLRRLKIRNISRERVTVVISIVEKLHHLQSLSLINNNDDESQLFPPLEGLSRCDHLQKLGLCGKIERLPDANSFPRHLVKLVLRNSNLQRDSIVKLERLSNLKMLSLVGGSYPFSELVCSSEGFPQLQVLQLIQEKLEEWTVEEGALKKLRHLKIDCCSSLKQVSEGFKSLTTLQELDIRFSPRFEHILRTNADLIEFTRKHSIKIVDNHFFGHDPVYEFRVYSPYRPNNYVIS